MSFAKSDQVFYELEYFLVFFKFVPKEPIDLIVLDVRVVVAAAGMSIFISHEKHRDALRNEESKEEVAHLSFAEGDDIWKCACPFNAAIPIEVLIVPVEVQISILPIVFVLVRYEVSKAESVVRRNEIYS